MELNFKKEEGGGNELKKRERGAKRSQSMQERRIKQSAHSLALPLSSPVQNVPTPRLLPHELADFDVLNRVGALS